jgi:hypothetical protein
MAKVWTTEKSVQDSTDIVPGTLLVELGCCVVPEQIESLFPQPTNLAEVGIPELTLEPPHNAYWLPCSGDGDGFLLSIKPPDPPKSIIPVTQSALEEFSVPITKAVHSLALKKLKR